MNLTIRVFVAALLVASLFAGCVESTHDGDEEVDGTASETKKRLVDGMHPCEATNESTGNGPYSLECTVSGDSVTIHFSNGGYISGTIDASGSGPYEGSVVDSRGNSWSVTIVE